MLNAVTEALKEHNMLNPLVEWLKTYMMCTLDYTQQDGHFGGAVLHFPLKL